MKKNLKVLFLTALVLLNVSWINAQCYFVDPPDPETNLENCASANGFLLAPYDTIRLLIIFAEINYNVNPDTNPNPNSTAGWPLHLLPTWANSVCDPFPPVGNPQGVLTRYYSEASSGGYLVLGDYLSIPNHPDCIFIVDESNILDPTGNYSYYEEALCNVINETMSGNFATAHDLNDPDYFDYWSFTERYQQKDKHCNTPHKYDNVTVIWRNHFERNNTGGAGLFSYGNTLGFESETSIEVGSYNEIPIEAIRHEFAHLIIGGNEFHSGGGWSWGGESYWIPITAGWAALGLHNSSIMTWSGWDRQRLNWKTPGNQFNPSARNNDNTSEVNGDLDASNPSHAGFYWLRDFVASGDAIRIKLPYIESSDFQQWLWIENHNGFDINNNPFDLFRYQPGNSCVQPCGYGLYMYQQIDREIREGKLSEVQDGYRDYLRPVTAEGLYDRILSDSVQNQCVNGNYYRPFTINQDFENPLSGGGDQESYAYDKDLNYNPKLDHNETNINFIEESNGNFTYELFFNGHTRHAFTKSGNNRIGIGTNPSSANFMNLVHYDAPAPDEPRNVRKVILNGISVEIVEQDAGGNIKLRIRFDDVDVVNNRRWCADSVVLFPPKAGAIYSLNITNGAKVVLDWSKTATRIENPKFYMGQTLFSDPTMFVCEANSILHVDTVSSMELINCSTLQMTDNSQLIIEPGAELRIKNKSTFLAREGSEIIVKGNGKIIVENGGYICFEEGALVTLTDVDSKIELMGGYHDGVNPDINITPTVNCTGMCDLVTSGLGSVTFNSATFPNDITIDTPVTWSNAVYSFGGDLTIASSGDLIIEEYSEMLFSNSGKIIIEPDGKLTINNSLITSIENCNSHDWHGIEVWGNPNASQNPFNQGVLVIQNGGKIENADVAVRAGSHDYTGKGGGMVMAMDAVFYNNDMALKFDPYSHDPSNQSYFTNCTFDYDKTITGEPDMTFVRLDDVDFVDFNTCTFTNHTNRDYFGWGIWSNNTILVVDGECIEYSGNDCLLWDQSEFYRLEYGIYVTNSNTTNYPEIQHTFFNDNYRGVFISGVTNALVKYCEFVVNTPFEADGGYGLYLDNCTAYTIEENFFSPTYENRIGIGLIVNNSGGDPNEVYRNSFSYLQQGVSAQELNRGFNDPAQGLQILCCDFTNCDADILVPKPSRKGWGIAPEQGAYSPDATDMAGNLFYIEEPSPDGDYDDINNEGGQITYYYPSNTQDNDVRPIDYTYNSVTIYPVFVSLQNGWTYNDGCPINESGGGGSSEEEMRSALYENDEEITVMEIALSAMVDGGNTEMLNDEVLTSLPPEALVVYNELMSESPNLSETVTGSTIEKEEVIPGSMLRDIMVANPHTSKSDVLLDMLDERENPLPDYMKAQILAGRSLVSTKEELESKIARKMLYEARAFNGLVHHYRNPAYGTAGIDSLIALFEYDNDLFSKYRLTMLYLERGLYEQGEDLLGILPSTFNLQGDDLECHQDITEFYTLSTEVLAAGGWELATTLQKVLLIQMSDATAPVSVFVRNVLIAMGEMEYDEPIQVPNLFKSSEGIAEYYKLLNSQHPSVLEVYPNPAKGFVILSFNLDMVIADGTIEIRTLEGKIVTTLRVTEPKDQLTVVTGSWKTGAYIATLSVNGKVAGSATFTIIN